MGIHSIKYIKAIHEVYFGETNGIKKIQNQLSIFRKRHIDKSFDIGINADPELYKLNRLFEDEFGFEVFTLNIIKENVYNAFTIPIGYKFDSGNLSENLISKKDGFKFNKKAGYACMVNIYSGIISNPIFTDREVLAIILHEIGHNFSGAVNKKIGSTYTIYKVLTGLTILILLFNSIINPMIGVLGIMIGLFNTNWFDKFSMELDKRIAQLFPKISYALMVVESINGKIMDIIGEVKFINTVMLTPTVVGSYGTILMEFIFTKIYQGMKNPVIILMKLLGYADEQFSDDFANIYGYGADLNSGLSKMTFSGGGVQSHDAMNRIPVVGQLFNLMWMPIELAVTLFDEHPVAPARIKNNLRTLEAELNKGNIDPKMKKRIENDIKELNKVYDKFYENLDSIKEPYLFKKMYYGWLYKQMGGDIKHMVNKIHTPEELDKGYESAMKNIKIK